MYLIGLGMDGIVGYPEGFGRRLGIIKTIDHLGGYEGVFVAVDEKHRMGRLADLRDGRGFLETPPIAQTAEQTGGVHQRERWQPELILQLTGKLIPHTRIATIVDETDIPHPLWQRLCRHHHRRGATHGDAMYDHRICLEHGQPMEHVFPVEPPHLNHVTIAQAMGMEVGYHHIIASNLLIVDAGDEQDVDRAVAPAMEHQGRLVAAIPDIEGMMALSRGHGQERVAQGMLSTEAINPGPCLRIASEEFLETGYCVSTVRTG